MLAVICESSAQASTLHSCVTAQLQSAPDRRGANTMARNLFTPFDGRSVASVVPGRPSVMLDGPPHETRRDQERGHKNRRNPPPLQKCESEKDKSHADGA